MAILPTRMFIVGIGIAISATAVAQDIVSLRSRVAEQESGLRSAVGEYNVLLQKLQADARNNNMLAADLATRRDEYLARHQIYSNVISLRFKDDLQKEVENRLNEASADSGYQRLGRYNPYEMSSYARFYDTSGKAIVSEVRGEFQLLKEQREYWEAQATRQREAAGAIQMKVQQDLTTMFGAIRQGIADLSDSKAGLANAEAEIARAAEAAQQAEAERRALEQKSSVDSGAVDFSDPQPLFRRSGGSIYVP